MTTDAIRQELEQAQAPEGQRSIFALIDRNEHELAKLLGPTMTVDRFKTVCATEFRRTPGLYECDPYSVVGALRLAAQLQLEPGPLGLVYLLPFKGVATFVLGYKGIVALAYRSGLVKSLTTGIVREGDAFDFRKGTRPFLDHTESGPPADRQWTHAYAVAALKSGGAVFEVLHPEQVEARRKRSPAARHDSGPWVTDTAAMWRKSAVRALAPMLPQTPALGLALDSDEAPVAPDGLDGMTSEALAALHAESVS